MVVQTVPKAACCTTHVLDLADLAVDDIYHIFGVAINERRDLKLSVITTGLYLFACFNMTTIIATFNSTSEITCEI